MSASVRYRIRSPQGERDRLVGLLFSLDCLGVEELDDALLAYFAPGVSAEAVRALGDLALGVVVEGPDEVPEEDWERSWRRGLAPRQVAGLWIRPSWTASRGEPELVIDPQQAFGSGEHASTRLALTLLIEALRPGDAVLDVGTGSGILALAGLRLGARRALGFDVDPVACRNAAENGARSGLPLSLYCGTPDALGAAVSFELVVANMLAERLAPYEEQLAAAASRALIVSGLLPEQAERSERRLVDLGLQVAARRDEPQSGDTWCALLLTHTRSRQ